MCAHHKWKKRKWLKLSEQHSSFILSTNVASLDAGHASIRLLIKINKCLLNCYCIFFFSYCVVRHLGRIKPNIITSSAVAISLLFSNLFNRNLSYIISLFSCHMMRNLCLFIVYFVCKLVLFKNRNEPFYFITNENCFLLCFAFE